MRPRERNGAVASGQRGRARALLAGLRERRGRRPGRRAAVATQVRRYVYKHMFKGENQYGGVGARRWPGAGARPPLGRLVALALCCGVCRRWFFGFWVFVFFFDYFARVWVVFGFFWGV